ncbi:uncharacterized protein LOC131044365 [Cryptomeria japonica]|uniref:uncharacterized protein LOC131044365 n=1 Tax=Cryptomeria japonica TaxID=3369 RepID=UPI0027DA70F9|nr:uncharacterized protein LOC131044365 [Cryptomeria japonica]XP_057833664.2 uncharacterized protein LOC131044365 [Cryptomeria japonica]XP_057833665.2 uncharacterized protein LOC131044365 [Cryptomeria japonica]XP_057833666.2 uncharacterized protein LOC131044365 [Cryptomeria japonica]
MDDNGKRLQQGLVEVEIEAERLLLAKQQLVECDRSRNSNREALTALRKQARTSKSSVPSPYESLMKQMGGSDAKVKEICRTCGDHDSTENTWMMFSGGDIFARLPFHAVHISLEKDQEKLDFDVKKLQSYVKDKTLSLSEKGGLSDIISPQVLRAMVSLKDSK